LKISNKPVRIAGAVEPEDIYWFNMKVTKGTRTKYMLYSWGVLIMVLALTFGALLGITFWKGEMNDVDTDQDLGAQASTMALLTLMSIITLAINKILYRIMKLLSFMERHKNKIRRLQSMLSKTVIAQTINTVFIHGIVYIIDPSVNILNTEGLAYQLNSLVITSGLYAIFKEIVIVGTRFKMWRKHRGIDTSEPIDMFQVKLNDKYKLPRFKVHSKYLHYVIFTFLIMFYGFLIPESTFFIILFFMAFYCLDKYNLFRRFCHEDLSW
jgi:hypothetical protein